MEFEIGLNSISSYKRLSYSPWHAIAEFIDNSTQSYFDNREELDRAHVDNSVRPVRVDITYRAKTDEFGGSLVINDNAMGMSLDELDYAMKVAFPPDNCSGRSKYGMGLKTAASWMGNRWSVTTKKLGDTVELTVVVDVGEIAAGNSALNLECRDGRPPDEHYTRLEICDHNQRFYGKTIASIKTYLSSMYRQDFRNDALTLTWNGEALTWLYDDDSQFLASQGSGSIYKTDFKFFVESDTGVERTVHGWVGVLAQGNRSKAGFSIFHAGRVIKGYPDNWRPTSLYGPHPGTNDLINQRLIGEIHLDGFEISHTKDHIVWLGEEEESVECRLKEHCWSYRDAAERYRKGREDRRGPTDVEIDSAISQLQSELESNRFVYWLSTELLLTDDLLRDSRQHYVRTVLKGASASFEADIADELHVHGYVEEMSPNDWYLAIERPGKGSIEVIVNKSHPHWKQLQGSAGVLNFLRHCVYDGIAESRARQQQALSIDLLPDTIKVLKDGLLRIPFEIEQFDQDD